MSASVSRNAGPLEVRRKETRILDCSLCGRSIASGINFDTFKRIATRKKRPLGEEEGWCLDCRRKEFAFRLVGENRARIVIRSGRWFQELNDTGFLTVTLT